jgi:hypothetical protein
VKEPPAKGRRTDKTRRDGNIDTSKIGKLFDERRAAATLPGSVSQRNYERNGFQVAYTKAIFVLFGGDVS